MSFFMRRYLYVNQNTPTKRSTEEHFGNSCITRNKRPDVYQKFEHETEHKHMFAGL